MFITNVQMAPLFLIQTKQLNWESFHEILRVLFLESPYIQDTWKCGELQMEKD